MNDDLPSALQRNHPASALRALAEREGKAFANFSQHQLVGLIGSNGQDRVRDAAAAEIRRLNTVAVREFDAHSSEQAARLVSLAWETSKQTNRLIKLTRWIIGLTLALGFIAILQLLAMVAM